MQADCLTFKFALEISICRVCNLLQMTVSICESGSGAMHPIILHVDVSVGLVSQAVYLCR